MLFRIKKSTIYLQNIRFVFIKELIKLTQMVEILLIRNMLVTVKWKLIKNI